MQCAPWAKLLQHGAVQSAVCRQDFTSKLMVAPLNIIVPTHVQTPRNRPREIYRHISISRMSNGEARPNKFS